MNKKLRKVLIGMTTAGMAIAMSFSLAACGESAYDIAVKNGFKGTEQEWLQSLQGEKGEKGDTGAQGAQGEKGEKGDKGDTGAQGAAGAQGAQGEKGDKGDTGAQGAAGAAGAAGAQGEKGDKGDKGDTGAQGENGKDGQDGEDGAAWYTGSKDPGTVENPKEGDFYLNTYDWRLYRYENSAWKELGCLKGLTGAPGETGAQGETGARGTLWFKGSTEPSTELEDLRAGDFYLLTYSDFSDKKGYKIYCYENEEWTLLIDMSSEIPQAEQENKTEYHIKSTDELVEFRDLVNNGDTFSGKTVMLGADISLNGIKNWTPIGTGTNKFIGTFDGQNHVISDLTINQPDMDNVGLFGSVPDGILKNLVLENVTVTGKSQVAALVGGAFTIDDISGITVRGNIKIEGNYKVGGIVGGSYGSVKNCKVEGTDGSYIKGVYQASGLEGDNVGGIIGYTGEINNTTQDHIFDCHVSGVAILGTRKVGGVVGYLHHGQGVKGCSFKNGTIECTASEEYIQEQGTHMIALGGIVGQTHHTGPAQAIIDNTVENVTLKILSTYVTKCKEGVELTSAILGNARNCSTQDGIAHAALIEASGNTASKVTVEAKLNDVNFGIYSGKSYVSSVTVYDVQGILDVLDLQSKESTLHTFGRNNAGENITTVYFAEGEYDLKDVDWKPLDGFRFSYIAQGEGATIKNMTMKTAKWRGGFVDSLSNGTIEGFTFENATIVGEQAGVVVGHTQGGSIKNVTLKGTVNVSYQKTAAAEPWPAIGFVFGIVADGNTAIENVKLASGTVATIDYGAGFTTQCTTFNSYFLGYTAGGTFTGAPTEEENVDIIVKNMPAVSAQNNTVRPTDGMYLDPGVDLTIDGTTADGGKTVINLDHTAFNYFNINEGILSGTIVIKNVHFKAKTKGAGYALTLGFDSTAHITFEGCIFEDMYTAIYCNQNTNGNATVEIKNCQYINTNWGYGLSRPDDLNKSIHVTFDSNTGLNADHYMEQL